MVGWEPPSASRLQIRVKSLGLWALCHMLRIPIKHKQPWNLLWAVKSEHRTRQGWLLVWHIGEETLLQQPGILLRREISPLFIVTLQQNQVSSNAFVAAGKLARALSWDETPIQPIDPWPCVNCWLLSCWRVVNVSCSRYTDISEKLGGEDEAADPMGKLIKNVASRFADENAIAEVRSRHI